MLVIVAVHLLIYDDDAGYGRDEFVYKGLDLSKNEAGDLGSSATQETLTSSTAVPSHRKYDNDMDKSPKLRRFRLSRDDRLSFTSGSCRRLAGCSSSPCAGHVVSLRPGGDECGVSDVTVSPPTPHDRVASSAASCRSLPTGLPLHLKPYPPSLIQTPGVFPSSMRGPSTTTAAAAAAAAAAFQRRSFLEALRSPPMHGYLDTAACDRNSAVSDLVAVPNASYTAASAAAVLGTQLAIHAWIRTALDSRTSPLRLTSDEVSYMPQGCHDWSRQPSTSPLPLTLRRFKRNSSPSCQPVDDVDEIPSQPDETSRPASEFSHVEETINELDDVQLQQSPSSAET